MKSKKKLDDVIEDRSKINQSKNTQQVVITTENATKMGAAFNVKIYNRLGYIIKLLEKLVGSEESNKGKRVI